MNPREKKSASQLRNIVLYQVPQHRDCNNILDIAIYRPAQSSENYPNWDAAFTMDGYRLAPQPAFQLVRQLQAQFECDWLYTPRAIQGIEHGGSNAEDAGR
jgi:hypothetical protein